MAIVLQPQTHEPFMPLSMPSTSSKCAVQAEITAKRTSEFLMAKQVIANASKYSSPSEISKEKEELMRYVVEQEMATGRPFSLLSLHFILNELYKLGLTSMELEMVSRAMERAREMAHMEEQEKNCHDRSSWLFGAGLFAGILGVLSGASGLMSFTSSGEGLYGTIQGAFDTFKDMTAKEGYEAIGKMLSSLSTMQGEMGKVRDTYAQGDHERYSTLAHLCNQFGEQYTRSLEDKRAQLNEMLQQKKSMDENEHQTASHAVR